MSTEDYARNHGAQVPSTVVEFLDVGGTRKGPVHKTYGLAINGTPVLVAEDSVRVELDTSSGAHPVTKIHLTLLPSEVHFTAREE